MNILKMIAIETCRRTPTDPAMPKKQLMKSLREAKRFNPTLARALKRMPDKAFHHFAYQVRETELSKLRAKKQTVAVVEQIADLNYSLRLSDEIKFWHNNKPRIKRRRYVPAGEPTINSVPRPTLFAPEPTPPPPEFARVGKPPIAEPVRPVADSFYGKFFHTPHDTVW